MAFNDPLQWVVIGIFVLLVLAGIMYVILRVLRTSSKVDRYVDARTQKGSTDES